MHSILAFILSSILMTVPAEAPAASPTPSPAASPSPSTSAAPKASPKPSPTPSGPFGHMKWRSVGPAASGGRVAAVAGSAANPKLYYLGAAGGGVWKSENGGATWDPVFDDQDVQSIGAISIAPNDDKIVWVGTGETNPRNDVMPGDGIYKSADAGKTWAKMGLSDLHSISRIVIDPANASHVVVGGLGDIFKDSSAGGVYETEDGGKTWAHTLFVGPSSGASDLAMDPHSPNVVWAGIWQFRRMPWIASSGGPDDGLYKSTDGAKTWTQATGHGLPTGLMGRIALAIAPNESKRIYALIQSRQGFLFRSDDSGAAWTMVNNDTLIDQRPFYFSQIAVDPTNKDHVYSVSELPSASKDGGKTFKSFADTVHVDYHAMWIAPNDPKRMVMGQDGGVVITLDGGKNWVFSRNYAIGQIYRVGVDDANPYSVCGGFQDNSGWCWPSNSRDDDGITNAYVTSVVGGDGEWVVPDPANADRVWTDLEDGVVHIWMNRSRQSYDVEPFAARLNGFSYDKQKYRFNWESPIAFAPWDPNTVWFGGNVVFQSHDEGRHWTTISPDLTRNIKSHQQISGGPINHDVSGAEAADNILDIEGGSFGRGVIWVGTDDGLVRLTRDGGKHWADITPSGVPPYGRVQSVAPSTLADGTAYAVFDRHYSGDYAPYIYKTTDFGGHWTSIAAGLPKDQPARSVRPDPVNRDIVYAGLQRSIWISSDGGKRWQSLQAGLPHTAVFDIRFQRRFDDLVIATHGRSAYIMDDIRPLQELSLAKAAGRYVFQPRDAYEYQMTEKAEGAYTEYGADNPPRGAIINFYESKKGKTAPEIDILDARGHVIRHVVGSHQDPISEKKVPWVTNDPGLNRFVWNFQGDPATPWYGAANKDERQPRSGVVAVPGNYSARVRFSNGQMLTRSFVVKPDPDAPWTQADYQERHDFIGGILAEFDGIDKGLNSIDAQIKRLKKLRSPRSLEAAREGAALETALTANLKNDEDSILYPPKLREDIEGLPFLIFGSQGPPLPPDYQAAAPVKARYDEAVVRIKAWLAAARAIK